MSDFLADSVLYWTFTSTDGDAYTGYTVGDTAALAGLPPGSVLSSPYGPDFGFYTVTNLVPYGVDLSSFYGIGYYIEGATVLDAYYDIDSGLALPTYYGSQGIPTTYAGLGSEYDFVPLPTGGYYEVGYGGYYLIY